MVLLLVFMQLTRDMFAIAKFLFLLFYVTVFSVMAPYVCSVSGAPCDAVSIVYGKF